MNLVSQNAIEAHEFAPTRDSLDHLFCAECFTPRDDVIVALCGRLRDGDPIGVPVSHPCVVCYTTPRCAVCGVEFKREDLS